MMDNLMPDIPRIYTAIAEWAACIIFIISLKKRYNWWKTGCIVSVFGYNRRCADFFLDPMYDHCSNAYDRFYLFLLRH